MVPPPPTSTLFPYTTLFRSDYFPPADDSYRKRLAPKGHRVLVHVSNFRPEVRQDRKSTRLNSSHRCISYAVFCLKKKKNKTTRPPKQYRELISHSRDHSQAD